MNENDPRTSFQAGEPDPEREPLDGEEPMDDDASSTAQSKLDRAVEALKVHERWGLALGVSLQLLVLVAMIVMGTVKVLRGDF